MASQGIYFTDELLEKAKARSEQLYKGKKAKLSAYIADLIERDLVGTTAAADGASPTILVDTARQLCGDLVADDLTKLLDGKDQRIELARFFHARTSPHWQLSLEQIGDLPHSLVYSDEDDRYYRSHPGEAADISTAVLKIAEDLAQRMKSCAQLTPNELWMAKHLAAASRNPLPPAADTRKSVPPPPEPEIPAGKSTYAPRGAAATAAAALLAERKAAKRHQGAPADTR